MNFRRDKFFRFHDGSSDDGTFTTRVRPSLNAVKEGVRRVFEYGSDKIRSLKKPIIFGSLDKKQPRNDKELGSKKLTLNPQEVFLQTWNKLFLLSCAFALAVDPLFFYIPVVDGDRKCLDLDDKLGIVVCVLRTFVDAFYIIHIIFQFHTAFIAPSSRVFGRGELIKDPWAIAKRYLCKYFVVDVLAILPLPQVVIVIIIPALAGPVSLVTKELLKSIIFCQYVPRIIRIIPLYKQVTSTSGILTETAWAGAALNLFLYMLASHAVGAFWYLFSIEREDNCWLSAIDIDKSFLYCDTHSRAYQMTPKNDTLVKLLTTKCAFVDPDDIKDPNAFNFGIFYEALQSGVLETWDFPKKFSYCFWWGLRNLSSLGQNLKTSTFEWEILFAVAISIGGLILFALLIGNMQTYLQSTGVRVEEMRVRRQDEEQWMSHRMLPDDLRQRIRRYEQYKWQETRGVEEDTLISNLPKDLRRDIKRHLCLDLLKRVSALKKASTFV